MTPAKSEQRPKPIRKPSSPTRNQTFFVSAFPIRVKRSFFSSLSLSHTQHIIQTGKSLSLSPCFSDFSNPCTNSEKAHCLSLISERSVSLSLLLYLCHCFLGFQQFQKLLIYFSVWFLRKSITLRCCSCAHLFV